MVSVLRRAASASNGQPPAARPERTTRRSTSSPYRRPKSQSPQHPGRRRLTTALWLGLVLGIAALLLLAYVADKGRDFGMGGFGESVLSTATGKGVGVVVAFSLLAFIAWCVRRLWLERLASRTGRVEVADFARSGEVTELEAAELTALFRQRLAMLRLQSPAPVPGSSPGGDFIQVLGTGGASASNPMGIVVTLLRAASPHHAYEVSGNLVERGGPTPCGVTIQVVRLPGQAACPETVFDTSWPRAVRRAADRATAHILPQTHLCGTPWVSWRNFVMPAALLEAYEDAVELELQRRFDEALDRYYDALREDPLNFSLRLHVGLLQEKMGLYLDAMFTYEGMIKVTAPGDQELPPGFYKPAARAERNRAMLIGRYRRAVLLGGDMLAWQWRKKSDPSPRRRDEQRTSLRERLGSELLEHTERAQGTLTRGRSDPMQIRAREIAHALASRPSAARLSLLATPEASVDRDVRDREYYELRELFAQLALLELPQIRSCIRSVGGRRQGAARPPVTEAGLMLTGRCIEERLRWVVGRLAEDDVPGSGRRWIWGDGQRLMRSVDAVGRLQRWHEHYNAACALSLPLLVDEGDRDEPRDVRHRLARAAVSHLEEATACVDNAYLASRRDWLVSEDPDLDGLRTHPRFKAFEALYFPAGQTTCRRPAHVPKLEASRYAHELLRETARRWADVWHDRRSAARERPQVPELEQWWEDEALIWKQVGHVAVNHRHWRARLELLRIVDASIERYGAAALGVSFRRYEDDPLTTAPDVDPTPLADEAIAQADARLGDLDAILAVDSGAGDAHALPGAREWLTRLRKLDSEGTRPSAEVLAQLCDRHAAAWGILAQWLSATPDDETTLKHGFIDELSRLQSALTVEHSAIVPRQNGGRFVRAGMDWLKNTSAKNRESPA